jgi:tRNA dimethylallyltransferase
MMRKETYSALMSEPSLPHALIIAGPTASGKSALALEAARRLNGAIINADSMQVYRELRILTARPTPEDEASAPHLLYGVRSAAEPSSAAWWREAALAAMQQTRAAGFLPILCGGTGLHFSALAQGLADIPNPGADAREEARTLLRELGPAALHARLAAADPETAARLQPHDSQRIARAWEVLRGTGRGLAAWHAQRAWPAPWRFSATLLDPPRAELRAAIASRFAAMLKQGALEEVRSLLALGLDPSVPAMRAHGVPELSAYLRAEISLEEASRRAELVTGQYTKRQATWFRHHSLATGPAMHTIHARFLAFEQFSERNSTAFLSFLQGLG